MRRGLVAVNAQEFKHANVGLLKIPELAAQAAHAMVRTSTDTKPMTFEATIVAAVCAPRTEQKEKPQPHIPCGCGP